MSRFVEIFHALVSAAIWVACLSWANLVIRQLKLQSRLHLSAVARVFLTLSGAALVRSPVHYIVFSIINLFEGYSVTTKIGSLVGAIAVVGVLIRLSTQADWARSDVWHSS